MERNGKHGKLEGKVFDYQKWGTHGINSDCYALFKHYCSEVTGHTVLDGYESAITLANGEAFRLDNGVIDRLLKCGISITNLSGTYGRVRVVLRLK